MHYEGMRINGAIRRTDNPPPGSSGVLVRWELTPDQVAEYLKKANMDDYEKFHQRRLAVEDFQSNSGAFWAQGWLTVQANREIQNVAFPIVCDIDARLTSISEALLTNRAGQDFSRFTFDFAVDALTNIRPYDGTEAEEGSLRIRVRQPRLTSGTARMGSLERLVAEGAQLGQGGGMLFDPVAAAKQQRLAEIMGHSSTGSLGAKQGGAGSVETPMSQHGQQGQTQQQGGGF